MKRTGDITLCAVLVSVAMALSYMERFIPLQLVVPLPGVKLGLANIVGLIALYKMGFKQAYMILALRCVLGSVFSGSVTSLFFSFTGGTLSMLAMAQAKRLPFLSVYGVSVLGAAAHNIGQIGVAMVMMHSVQIGAYLPYLLCVGIATGLATGAAGAGVLRAFSMMKRR